MRNQLTCSKLWKLCEENSSKSQLKEARHPSTDRHDHVAASLCVCVFVSLVGLSARASSQALSYSSDSDSYNCSWATDRARERRMGERGTGNRC